VGHVLERCIFVAEAPDRHKQMGFLRCFSIMFVTRNGTFGCSLLVSPMVFVHQRGMLVLCPDVSCPAIKAKDNKFDVDGDVTRLKRQTVFLSMEFPYDSGLEMDVCYLHDLHVIVFWHQVEPHLW